MAQKNLSRRQFLRGAGFAGAGLVALLAGCQPKIVEVTTIVEKAVKETVPEKVVKETVVSVQKEVVKETVVVAEASGRSQRQRPSRSCTGLKAS